MDEAKGSFRSGCSNYLRQMIMYPVPPQLRTRLIPSSYRRHRPMDLLSGSVACSTRPCRSGLGVDQRVDIPHGEGSSGGSWFGSSNFGDSDFHYRARLRFPRVSRWRTNPSATSALHFVLWPTLDWRSNARPFTTGSAARSYQKRQMPTQCGEMRPNCAIALVERSSLVSLIRAYLSLLVIFPCTKQECTEEIHGRWIPNCKISAYFQR